MADENIYCGSWKITKCISLAAGTEVTEVEGTVFTLDESGDLSWTIPDNAAQMPFFSCETYEVFLGNPHYIRFFGTFAGHMIEFRVAHADEDGINLIYEGWCVLQCVKLTEKEFGYAEPFSYLPALEEGYFSDAVITAEGGKEFPVHLTLLRLSCPAVEWVTGKPSPLDGLPEDVVAAALHCAYADCLPPKLTEATARACVSLLSPPAAVGFDRLVHLCELFLRNMAVKQRVMSLMNDMHQCAATVADCFNAPSGGSGGEGGAAEGSASPTASPARLCYVVGQALRECAVAAAKLLLLCGVFSRHKHLLSREERQDLIKHCVSRLPTFMNQLQKLLEAVKRTFGNLSFAERTVIAAYVVPEIESSLESLFQLIAEAKRALDLIISRMTNDKMTTEPYVTDLPVGEMLNRNLRNSLNVRELVKLRSFYEKVFMTFITLMRKKESFCDMGGGSKIRSVAKNLEQFIDEIPMLLLRIEELRSAVLEKQSCKEWKFLFKLGTSKVAWVLNKLVSHRETLHLVMTRLCDLVARDQFTAALVELGIVVPTPEVHQNGAEEDDAATVNASPPNSTTARTAEVGGVLCGSSAGLAAAAAPADPERPQSAPIESLCRPPPAKESRLARDSLQLFLDGKGTDMSFEIVAAPGYSGDSSPEPVNDAVSGVRWQIGAHRVVVATRCNWFKKALLSGMRESIDRKIVVHDTHPEVFQLFLEYLYRGCLESRQLTTEQLVELMQLGDRYEVDVLKTIAEDALRDHVDEDSALFLLNLADQLHARNLRNSALEFIAINKNVVKSDGYSELPDDLQTEIMETITWFELRSSQRPEDVIPFGCQFEPASPSSASSSLLDIDEFASALSISGKETDATQADQGAAHSSAWSSLEELPLTQDSAQLEVCVEQLRDVVGEAVPREALVQVSLAADYDVNRALNFFFA
ncbi:LOW QUALITY PROTEIN: uncharacterized protein LOC119453092 [Dermacentor silvarum]|uniref:LOW QUALITY PROTEIN: uncharacterized protein LOC119453092 n=1 Tax=Dermacentor silvarum TaxID=543639 RepID=UPI00189882FC|nr:LOW QUALITY PROTEIN: uncharacterized protein LOC119453092 [Dermacentor silvarum]